MYLNGLNSVYLSFAILLVKYTSIEPDVVIKRVVIHINNFIRINMLESYLFTVGSHYEQSSVSMAQICII